MQALSFSHCFFVHEKLRSNIDVEKLYLLFYVSASVLYICIIIVDRKVVVEDV